MIESFTVSNFGSIKEPATMELSPYRSRGKTDHISDQDCLKTAVIFGGNASGKSTFIKALKTLKQIVTDPFFSTTFPIGNWDMPDSPTVFDLHVNIDSLHYEYHLVVEPVDKRTKELLKTSNRKKGTDPNHIMDRPPLYLYSVVEETLYVGGIETNGLKERVLDLLIDNNAKAEINEKLTRLLEDNRIAKLDLEEKMAEINELQNEADRLNAKLKDMRAVMEQRVDADTRKSFESGTIDLESPNQIETNSYHLLKEIKDTENDMRRINSLIDQGRSIIARKTIEINSNRDVIEREMSRSCNVRPLLKVKPNDRNPLAHSKPKVDQINRLASWFVSSLIILETDDFHLPLDEQDLEDKLSKIIESMDVGIHGLSWSRIDNKNEREYLDLIKALMQDRDNKRIRDSRESSIENVCMTSTIVKMSRGLYLFVYWIGEESVFQLTAYHDLLKQKSIDLSIESDGTRRLIELASILIPTDKDRVYVVDELDRRLHPKLTLRFMDLFFNDVSSHKQLIFSTHETGLMTTELFRMDEIWFVERDDDGSHLYSLADLPQDSEQRSIFNKRINKLYMEDVFGGIPHLGDVNDLVHKK